MLLCDGCDNGFHSTCVGITPAEMAALTKGQHDASHSILICRSVSLCLCPTAFHSVSLYFSNSTLFTIHASGCISHLQH